MVGSREWATQIKGYYLGEVLTGSVIEVISPVSGPALTLFHPWNFKKNFFKLMEWDNTSICCSVYAFIG